jgi:aryl-alcohol dehydrogenase-like predicted oxidoreductase
MQRSFTHSVLGRTGMPVHRLGLSASYLPGREAVHRAVDAGLNYFFCYGFDFQMIRALREILKTDRERYVVATGPYNLIWGHTDVRRTEKR